MSRVYYTIGNTYREIPRTQANLDRSGRFRKTHEWTLYVEIAQGSDPNVIERVVFDLGSTFEPRNFVCCCPVPSAGGGWRFTTKQQSYGLPPARISLRGAGGSKCDATYQIEDYNAQETTVRVFEENRPVRPTQFLKLDETQRFGIELELSSPLNMQPQQVAGILSSRANVGQVVVIDSYSQGRETLAQWKLVPDGSIVCNRSQPDCNKFELVSPVLQGGHGLSVVNNVLRALSSLDLKVNKSMGFHVHIDVSQLSLQQLIKICQNFVKYEDVMDSFMPASRRSGSMESDQYFRSNRVSVGPNSSNRARNDRLAQCRDIQSLVDMMNGMGEKYYKLNLQNLSTGRQPTLEFRQHSATAQYAKVSAWIRFCCALVQNSSRLAPPGSLAENKPLKDQFQFLFAYVIKDRALRDFYLKRQEEVSHDAPDDEGICSICLVRPRWQDLASIDSCSHQFCFNCITEWSQQERACPLCKKEFTTISRIHPQQDPCCDPCASGGSCATVRASNKTRFRSHQ